MSRKCYSIVFKKRDVAVVEAQVRFMVHDTGLSPEK